MAANWSHMTSFATACSTRLNWREELTGHIELVCLPVLQSHHPHNQFAHNLSAHLLLHPQTISPIYHFTHLPLLPQDVRWVQQRPQWWYVVKNGIFFGLQGQNQIFVCIMEKGLLSLIRAIWCISLTKIQFLTGAPYCRTGKWPKWKMGKVAKGRSCLWVKW